MYGWAVDRAGNTVLSADNSDAVQTIRAVSRVYIAEIEAAEAKASGEGTVETAEEADKDYALAGVASASAILISAILTSAF